MKTRIAIKKRKLNKKKNKINKDFSSVEDSVNAIRILRKIGVRAVRAAAAEAKAAGLPRFAVINNEIVKIFPNGKEKILKGNKTVSGKYFIKFKSSTVFHKKVSKIFIS
jgi:hypothetical protein